MELTGDELGQLGSVTRNLSLKILFRNISNVWFCCDLFPLFQKELLYTWVTLHYLH